MSLLVAARAKTIIEKGGSNLRGAKPGSKSVQWNPKRRWHLRVYLLIENNELHKGSPMLSRPLP
jgi:hypothetical protein